MSYRSRGNRSRDFSVTSGQDGSRTFFGDHDDRWRDNSSRGFQSRGWRRGTRGYRSGSRFKNLNTNSMRYGHNRTNQDDEDGDISMSGDSRGSSTGRYTNSRYRRGSRRSGGHYNHGGHRLNQGQPELKWFKVVIPYGAKMEKDFLLNLISQNYDGEFKPVQYVSENERVHFFIEGQQNAESLKGLNRRITKPDGHKMVLHISPQPSFSYVDPASLDKLKLRMSSRYDPSTQLLNLSALSNDEVLNKDHIFLPLNRISTMDAVTGIIAEHIPELSGLDISSNRILSLSHMSTLVKATPGMHSLNLGQNQIRSLNELEKLKGWSNISELVLQGNDFCNNYSNQNTYVSAVRKIFLKVMKLDGNDLPPPITFDVDKDLKIPLSKGSYFVNDDIQKLVVSFIKEYYSVYDSDKLRDLIPAYHENAQFSVCVSKNLQIERQIDFNQYLDETRNLKKIGHLHSDKLVRKTKIGVLAVVSLLESLPKTTHDFNSFKVDVTLASKTMLSFVVHGMFKESESKSDKPVIRSFSRTFITVPFGQGMVVINDMLTLSNAGIEQVKNAFKDGALTPSSSPVSSSQSTSGIGAISSATSSSPSYTPDHLQMVDNFSLHSGMNPQFSLKCLEENSWNYQLAGKIFTDLHAQGKIPPDAFVKTS